MNKSPSQSSEVAKERQEVQEIFTKNLEILKSNIDFNGKKISPINIFNDFLKQFSKFRFTEVPHLVQGFEIKKNTITIGKNFSLYHIPKLIQSLDQIDQLPDFIEKLSGIYTQKAQQIHTILKNPHWNAQDEVTKDVRKLFSKKAYFYFLLSEVYKGKEVFDNNRHPLPNQSKNYEQFLSQIPSSVKIPHYYQAQTDKIQRIQEWKKTHNTHQIGNITSEFLEYYGSDDIFDLHDIETLRTQCIQYIETLSAGLSKKDKQYIIRFIQNFSLTTEIRDRQEIHAKYDPIESKLFTFATNLDTLIKKKINKNLIKSQRKELFFAENYGEWKMKKILENDLTNVLFENAEKDLWEKSNIPQIFKENFGKKDFVNYIKKHFSAEFPNEWKNIKFAHTELTQARNEKNIEKQTHIEMQIGYMLCAIIYSEKFWKYTENNYSFEKIIQKKVNCITRSQILHQVFKEIFEIETLNANTHNHTFEIMPLSNGTFMTLDAIPINLTLSTPIRRIHKVSKNIAPLEYIDIQTHLNGHKANIWITLGAGKENNQTIYSKKKALELNPNSPTYWRNMAVNYYKLKQENEMKQAYEQILKLVPQSIEFQIEYAESLVSLNKKNRDLSKKMFLEIIKNNPENPNGYFALAFFYGKHANPINMKEAKKYYEIGARIYNKNPNKYILTEVIPVLKMAKILNK